MTTRTPTTRDIIAWRSTGTIKGWIMPVVTWWQRWPIIRSLRRWSAGRGLTYWPAVGSVPTSAVWVAWGTAHGLERLPSETLSPYQLGRGAYITSVARSRNPYSATVQGDKFVQWQNGWDDEKLIGGQ